MAEYVGGRRYVSVCVRPCVHLSACVTVRLPRSQSPPLTSLPPLPPPPPPPPLQLLPGNPVEEKDAKALAKALKRNKKFSIRAFLGIVEEKEK